MSLPAMPRGILFAAPHRAKNNRPTLTPRWWSRLCNTALCIQSLTAPPISVNWSYRLCLNALCAAPPCPWLFHKVFTHSLYSALAEHWPVGVESLLSGFAITLRSYARVEVRLLRSLALPKGMHIWMATRKRHAPCNQSVSAKLRFTAGIIDH